MDVWIHLPKAIYFTVYFFLVRACPNSLMIQFMANIFQPITCLRKGWSGLPYPHTASKLISRDGPSAHLLLASCHLHPAIPHPAPAPKNNRHRVYWTGHFPSKTHRKGPEPTTLLDLITPNANHNRKNQHQDRWTRYASLWSILWDGESNMYHSNSQQQGQEHTLYCVFWHCNGKLPWGSLEQNLWISPQANTQEGIRHCFRNAPVTRFFSQLSRYVPS